MSKRWTRRPEGSNWGEFGDDDQLGRVNLLTPARVKAAMAEVQEGKRFCLSLPLDRPGGRDLNPRRFPPRHFATERGGLANFNLPLSIDDPRHLDVVCDDAVLLCLQYSSQWDSFAHVGARFDADGDGIAEHCFYNGWTAADYLDAPQTVECAAEFQRYPGARVRRLGIENMAAACIQGRGVLIDLYAHFGEARHYVGYDDLMDVLAKDQVIVEEGDIVCLHTGFGKMLMAADGHPSKDALHNAYPVLDGRDSKLQNWIRDSGVAILIADNYAVEGVPSKPPADDSADFAAMPLHHLCLFKLGIHLGELWYLTDLADHLRGQGRSRFLMTAPPLRLPGAVGSPANAIATV